MSVSIPDQRPVVPRAVALLPIAYLLHLAEEWFGGFSAWTLTALGNEISAERFVLINAIAMAVFAIGTLAAFHYPRMAWFGASIAALVGLNGVLHTLATIGYGYYSPGTLTGLLLYVPLSASVLRSYATVISRPVLVRSVFFGILMHGLIALIAFL
jgi:hypothetical protein